jgi:glycosyltransferase involved in cell wall biosynthesis
VLRNSFGIDSKKKIVANISAIAPHKHYKTFVDTAAKILSQNTDFHFFIIGDGPCRNEIELYVKEKNLSENITFTGFRNDIPEIFPDLDFFLMTSETEGLGSTLLDAAANRVPIISAKAGGIPEFVEDRKTGLLSDIYDSESLAKHILELDKNSELQKTLTVNAFNKLVNAFTKDKMAQKTIEIYDTILSK